MKVRRMLFLLIIAGLFYSGYQYMETKKSNQTEKINDQQNVVPQKNNQEKLKEVGYSNEETNIIIDKLTEEKVNFLLEQEYNNKITPIIQEKYFREDKLEAYLKYWNKNTDRTPEYVVSLVNAGADKKFYTEIQKTDTSKGILMLVNKFYKLDENFAFDDIVSIDLKYAYSGRSIKKEVLDNFIDMWNDANKLNLSLIISSAYRDYDWQSGLYNNYVKQHGQIAADTFSAKPGHSEHQTALTIDISVPGQSIDDFGETKEFVWVKDNAHKYGFILRYPKNKNHITGYDYEPWHYRYVGKEVAKEIYDLNITFDEYYELFIKDQ